MAIEEQWLQVGNLDWFYRQILPPNPSDRTPVLLLHGLPSQSYSWRGIMKDLAEQGYQAIAPDWIGLGFSDKPDRRDFAYTPEAYVTALADFITALGLERLILVVQGFLGSAGLQYACRHPEKIERLVILNTPLSSEAKLPWKIKQMGLPLVGDMMTQDPLLVDRTLEGGGPYQVDDKDLDVYRRPFLQSSDAGRSLLAAIRNLQLPQATAEIEAGFLEWTQPILVIWGTADPWLSVELAQKFVNSVPAATLSELSDVGHYPQEDWSEKVSEVLLPFLRRQIF